MEIVRATRPLAACLAAAALVAGCSLPGLGGRGDVVSPQREPAPPPTPAAAAAAEKPPEARGLPPPETMRSWAELRRQAAERLVAANPGRVYTGRAPDPLLAIPVLEIELNADGSVRRIDVLRTPRQAKETVQLAVDAVHRAAPFGNVSRLPRPWKFVETFLFDDERRFKPRTLEP
ncbi:hypothetical protein HQN59_11040 [Schlegelella sp. ID0723]|uniref:TonB C-terminal domain-containing protein n=1 Tax=Piscinibacter koreensis TaxID=2742824 RepID=A0A7Y6NNE0_9BURK|nr:hypothetical protein [Schlegelella koreensis]